VAARLMDRTPRASMGCRPGAARRLIPRRQFGRKAVAIDLPRERIVLRESLGNAGTVAIIRA
jgi:Fe2+ transport system protein FeoA